VEEGAGSVQLPSVRQGLLSTFRALSDWGDNFERTHFDGNFLGAVSSAPRRVGKQATRIGEELGSATAKLVEEATGRALGQVPGPMSGGLGGLGSLGALGAPAPVAAAPAAPGAGSTAVVGPPAGATGLWDEVRRLQEELAKER